MARHSKLVQAACLFVATVLAMTVEAAAEIEAWDGFTRSRNLMTTPLTQEEAALLYKRCALSLGTNPARFYEVELQCCDVLDADSFDKFDNVTIGTEPGFKEICGNACKCRLAEDITCICGTEEVSQSAVSLGIAFSLMIGLVVLICCVIDKFQTASAKKIDKRVHEAFVANESMHELLKEDTLEGKPSL